MNEQEWGFYQTHKTYSAKVLNTCITWMPTILTALKTWFSQKETKKCYSCYSWSEMRLPFLTSIYLIYYQSAHTNLL